MSGQPERRGEASGGASELAPLYDLATNSSEKGRRDTQQQRKPTRLSGKNLLAPLDAAASACSATSLAGIFETLRCATAGVSTTGGATSVTVMFSGAN